MKSDQLIEMHPEHTELSLPQSIRRDVARRLSLSFMGWLLALALALLASSGPSLAVTPEYPLKRGPNPRYLVDQNDRPFLIHGDAPWSLIAQPTREEAEEYLKNRHNKGFNSIIVNLIEHQNCDNPPYNRYGAAPFNGSNYTKPPGEVHFTNVEFTTPNEAYFAHVDWVLKKAEEYGMQVFLIPAYLGNEVNGAFPEGWNTEMLANGTTKMREYGRYVGNRYKDFDNIIWLNGGDHSPVGAEKDNINAIAEGILEFDTRHLHTAHTGPEYSALDWYSTESWLAINNTYSYLDVLNMSRTDYLRTPATPFFLLESNYVGDWHNASNREIRRQAYWSLFSGSCGQLMGNYPLYAFKDDAVKGTWRAAMDGETSLNMANLRRLLDSRDWWKFVPDLDNTIVVAGAGNPAITDPASSEQYVTAARIPDGSALWAYIPSPRTITVDMTRISGSSVKAWWFSPRTAAVTSIGEFSNSGTRDFTTPATEGASQDWVLVLDDAALNSVPPGTTNLQNWLEIFFSPSELSDPAISGELADPDHDGNNNLMEYALCGDPTLQDAGLTRLAVNFPNAGTGDLLNVTYARRRNASDMTFHVVVSSDGQTWEPLAETVTQDHGTTESVFAQDSSPPIPSPQRFIRLQIAHNPE